MNLTRSVFAAALATSLPLLVAAAAAPVVPKTSAPLLKPARIITDKVNGIIVPKIVSPLPTPSFKMDAVRPSGPPYVFTAPALMVTGTGMLDVRPSFEPIAFTSPGFTITGTGSLGEHALFSPKTFTAPSLTVTGTGALR